MSYCVVDHCGFKYLVYCGKDEKMKVTVTYRFDTDITNSETYEGIADIKADFYNRVLRLTSYNGNETVYNMNSIVRYEVDKLEEKI